MEMMDFAHLRIRKEGDDDDASGIECSAEAWVLPLPLHLPLLSPGPRYIAPMRRRPSWVSCALLPSRLIPMMLHGIPIGLAGRYSIYGGYASSNNENL